PLAAKHEDPGWISPSQPSAREPMLQGRASYRLWSWPPNGSRLSCGRIACRRKGVGTKSVPRQRHNTPIPLERSSPGSFKRMLGSGSRTGPLAFLQPELRLLEEVPFRPNQLCSLTKTLQLVGFNSTSQSPNAPAWNPVGPPEPADDETANRGDQ